MTSTAPTHGIHHGTTLTTFGSVVRVEGDSVTLRSSWSKGNLTGKVYPTCGVKITVPVTECDLYR